MANAIAMIRRCAKHGTPGDWYEYGPPEELPAPGPSLPEEPMGNVATVPDESVAL